MSKAPRPSPPRDVIKPPHPPAPPPRPKGFNESHARDCDCRICMMARDGCPLRGSFRNKIVEK